MNTIQKIIAGICIMAIPFLGSCGKDDPVSCNYTTEVQAEANAFSAAANLYATDPSTANCNAYRVSAQNYHDALEDHRSCATVAGQQAEFQAALDNLQVSINSIQC
ncbi:MAG: hypothetical protein ABIQ02_02795 [Saprospiraceae bacterium]